MKVLILASLLILVSCGKASEGGSTVDRCQSRAERVLQCRAERAAEWNPYPTAYQLEQDRLWCEREFPILQCY